MTELEAAIGIEQLKKLPKLVDRRRENAQWLDSRLGEFSCLKIPVTSPGCLHGYYVYAMRYVRENGGPSREAVVSAIRAEGIPVGVGYVEPIYLQPVYQKKIAFGKNGFPFTSPYYDGCVSYAKGICPVTERMHFEEVITGDFCHANLDEESLGDIAKAFEKVFSNLSSLS